MANLARRFAEMTRLGLELRVEIAQFREQA
jgi:hypothetical protein